MAKPATRQEYEHDLSNENEVVNTGQGSIISDPSLRIKEPRLSNLLLQRLLTHKSILVQSEPCDENRLNLNINYPILLTLALVVCI